VEIQEITNFVRQTSFDIHAYHGPGHLEKPYENALANRLRKAGLQVEQQFPISIYDEDGTSIGEYVADLLIEGELIAELKAVKNLNSEHVAQLMGYLKSSRKKHGVLINFGANHFEIKKYIWDPEYPGRAGFKRGAVSSVLFMIGALTAPWFRV